MEPFLRRQLLIPKDALYGQPKLRTLARTGPNTYKSGNLQSRNTIRCSNLAVLAAESLEAAVDVVGSPQRFSGWLRSLAELRLAVGTQAALQCMLWKVSQIFTGMKTKHEIKALSKPDFLFLRRRENLSQQNREPTNSTIYDTESGNRIRATLATLVGGECSHHYASPAPWINYLDKLPYYRKVTLHEIKVLEINATLIIANLM